jgi:hypothetical protein
MSTPAVTADRRVPPGSDDVRSICAHVIERIGATQPGQEPFRHLYVEDVLPDEFYELLRAHMLAAKARVREEDRRRDSSGKALGRFHLLGCKDPVISTFRAVFSDRDVISAFASKFYIDLAAVVDHGLTIHSRFEYVFTKAGRSQCVHVDIPPKYMSLVFYIPELSGMTEDEERNNATIFYDGDLRPRPCLNFRKNAVSVFAPHFRTYHGYAATADRDVIVMFYSNPAEQAKWKKMRAAGGDVAPFDVVRDLIEDKLRRHPLIELGRDEAALRREREACRINAPEGAVERDIP